MHENLPGEFPYAAGVFPLKRVGEDPARMFAGEGGPERTNKRFHYVSKGQPAKRLSTAFDSVTLYGEDPDRRPDIYGKVGNSGVSVATVDDAKKLYSGFDLSHKATSVSMTINGPAPMVLAFSTRPSTSNASATSPKTAWKIPSRRASTPCTPSGVWRALHTKATFPTATTAWGSPYWACRVTKCCRPRSTTTSAPRRSPWCEAPYKPTS